MARAFRLLRVAGLIASGALASCGGGGGGTSAMPQPASSPQSANKTAQVLFTIQIPRKASAHNRTPQYVSASTASVTLSVTPHGGGGTTSNSAACTGPTCSVSVQAPIGADDFKIQTFDSNATPNLLSSGSLSNFTVVQGVLNTFNVTFNPVVATLQLSGGTTLPTDVAGGGTMNAIALDADGNTIVGPGNFVDANLTPITLTLTENDSETPTRITITSPNTVTAPGAGQAMNYTYSGSTVSTQDAAPVTFTLAATGNTTGIVNATAQVAFLRVIHIQPQTAITCDAVSCGYTAVANGASAVEFNEPVGVQIEFVNDDTVNPRTEGGFGSGGFPASFAAGNATCTPGTPSGSTISGAWCTGNLAVSGGTSTLITLDTAGTWYFGDFTYYTGVPPGGSSVGSDIVAH